MEEQISSCFNGHDLAETCIKITQMRVITPAYKRLQSDKTVLYFIHPANACCALSSSVGTDS